MMSHYITHNTENFTLMKALYVGETGRNKYARGLDYQEGLDKEKEDNTLWKHCQIQHGGRKVQFVRKLKSLSDHH